METSYRKLQLGHISRDSLILRYLWSGSLRASVLALIWWVLTDGAVNSWLVGATVVLFATLASVMLLPPYSWSLMGIVRFVPFFLWRSLRGGVDVAMRVFHPRMPIVPQITEYPLQLPSGLPRIVMVNTVSLLPGTLSTELKGDCLRVHVLDAKRHLLSELGVVEQAVARVFGIRYRQVNEGECNEAIQKHTLRSGPWKDIQTCPGARDSVG